MVPGPGLLCQPDPFLRLRAGCRLYSILRSRLPREMEVFCRHCLKLQARPSPAQGGVYRGGGEDLEYCVQQTHRAAPGACLPRIKTTFFRCSLKIMAIGLIKYPSWKMFQIF